MQRRPRSGPAREDQTEPPAWNPPKRGILASPARRIPSAMPGGQSKQGKIDHAIRGTPGLLLRAVHSFEHRHSERCKMTPAQRGPGKHGLATRARSVLPRRLATRTDHWLRIGNSRSQPAVPFPGCQHWGLSISEEISPEAHPSTFDS